MYHAFLYISLPSWQFFLPNSRMKATARRGKFSFRACSHGGGGPQLSEVARLGGVKKITLHPSRGALFQDYWTVAKHVNKKNAGKPRVFAHLLLLLQLSVLWLSIVTFDIRCKATAKVDLMYNKSATFKRLHDKILPWLRGLPGLGNLTCARLSDSIEGTY